MKKGDLVWTAIQVVEPGFGSLYSSRWAPALGLYTDDAVTTGGHQSPILLINGEARVEHRIFATEAEVIAWIDARLEKSAKLLTRYGKHRVKTEYYGTVKIDSNFTEEDTK